MTPEYGALFQRFDELLAADPSATFRGLRDLWLAGEYAGLPEAPDGPWKRFLEAAVAWRAGDDLSALDALVSGQAGGRHGWMRYYVAEVLLRRLDAFALAREQLDRTAADCVWLWEALCLRTEAAAALGPADTRALDALEVPLSNLEAFRAWRGAIKVWLGRPDGAQEDLDAAAALGSHDARCWRGALRARENRNEDALPDLDAVLAKDPSDAEALVWRGEVLRRLGRGREARLDLDRAIGLSDGAVWAFANRALLRLAEGDEAGARADAGRLMPPRYEDQPDESGAGALRYELALPAAPLRELLEEALKAARGCRRSDTHLNCAWMRAAGAPVPERPTPQARLVYWLRAQGAPTTEELSFPPDWPTPASLERRLSPRGRPPSSARAGAPSRKARA